MRDSSTWVDHMGVTWPVLATGRRLKFSLPAHAALRAHVFHRDGFKCARCLVEAADPPFTYDGRRTLYTTSILKSGFRDVLILDHILTLKAGGKNAVENFQTLCETCNKRKQKEDRAATAAFLEAKNG